MRKTHPLLPLLLIIALSLSITMCGKTKPGEEEPTKPTEEEPQESTEIEALVGNCSDVLGWAYNCPSAAACGACIDKDNCPGCVAKGRNWCVGPWPYHLSYSCLSDTACYNCYNNGDCSACTQIFLSEDSEERLYVCPSWATSDKCFNDNECSACIELYESDGFCEYGLIRICPDYATCTDCINNDNCSACTSTGKFLCETDEDEHGYICPSAVTCAACVENNDCSGCTWVRGSPSYGCRDPSDKQHTCPNWTACWKCKDGDCSECIPPERYCEGPEEDSEYLCPDAAACATCASQGQCSTCTRIE